MSQGRKFLAIMPGCSMAPEKFDAIAETSQFTDHLARSHLLRLFAHGRPALLVPHALVKNLSNEATDSMGDRTDGLSVTEARDEPTVRDREDGPLRLHRGVGCLIQDASHLTIALGQR